MKKQTTKLVLSKETLKNLELREVLGGKPPKYTQGGDGTECAIDTQAC